MRVLVVGASSGLGLAIARELHGAGALVALAARRRSLIEAEAARLGSGAHAVPCDVRSGRSCASAVATAVAHLGGIDALVYAAGSSPLIRLRDAGTDDWRDVLETNVVGAALVTSAALGALRASDGRCIYLSSYAVRQSLPGLGLYSTSKVALDGLIQAWRAEYPELRFTRAVVGNTRGTEFAAHWDDEELRSTIQLWIRRNIFPSPTLMPPEVCAEAIASILASDGYIDDVAIMPRPCDPAVEEASSASARPPAAP